MLPLVKFGLANVFPASSIFSMSFVATIASWSKEPWKGSLRKPLKMFAKWPQDVARILGWETAILGMLKWQVHSLKFPPKVATQERILEIRFNSNCRSILEYFACIRRVGTEKDLKNTNDYGVFYLISCTPLLQGLSPAKPYNWSSSKDGE